MELECIRLNSLISEILDFARLDKSTVDLNLASTNIVDLLSEVQLKMLIMNW